MHCRLDFSDGLLCRARQLPSRKGRVASNDVTPLRCDHRAGVARALANYCPTIPAAGQET